MPFLYLLNFINIINVTSYKKIAILSKNNIIQLDKLVNDEQTGRLMYHGLIIDYCNGLHKYEISDTTFNYIITNANKKEIIKIIVEKNSIFFMNKNKNIKKEIANMNYNIQSPITYNDIQLYF
jgi:hypothetical protein